MLRNIESLSNVFSLAVLTGRGRIPRNYQILERNIGMNIFVGYCIVGFIEFEMRQLNRTLNRYSYESQGIRYNKLLKTHDINHMKV